MKTLVLKPGSAPAVTSFVVSEPTFDAHAGGKGGEVEEVPVVLGEVPDLLGRDVGRDLDDRMSTASSPMTVTFSA